MKVGESTGVRAMVWRSERARSVVLGVPVRAEAVQSRVGVLEPKDVVFEICAVRVRDVVGGAVSVARGLGG